MRQLLIKILSVLSIIIFYSIQIQAQGTVTGVLHDNETKKPLYLATVTVFKAQDTTVVTYRLSNEAGLFKISGIPININCRVLVSFNGYKTFRKEFMLSQTHQTLDLGTLSLDKDTTTLDEVLVMAERPPMVVRKDTIEFNAASFKTLPNALVEDLLKKLPGVMVDANGNITVNGKPVNRILVDGKTFFGDDPKMATRNLPSNVIDKVQVTDDKEEMLRNGDDNLNNVGKVINLTFKKGVKKGWFGKAYAGGGTPERYEAGAIANIFRDTLQLSLLGYSNNLNRPGFGLSDLMQTGGMQRNSDVSSSRSISIWNNRSGGQGIKVNDINFGGMSDYGGISTSSGAGINMNHSPNNRQSIFAQYFYGNVKVKAENQSYTDYYDNDTTIKRSQEENASIITNAHNIGLGAKLKPDSVTSIIANFNYMQGNTINDKTSDLTNTHSYRGQLSMGDVQLLRNNISKNYTHNINFSQLSRHKKGRRYNINQSVNWRLRDNSAVTNSLIHYKFPAIYDSVFHQLRNENIPTLTVNTSVNYSEPFSSKFSVRFDARHIYERLKNTIYTYDPDNTGNLTTLNPLLSNLFTRNSNSWSSSAGIEYKNNKLTITPRVRYQAQQFVNRLQSLPDDVVQQVNNFLPELSIVYAKFNFNYRKEVILPGYKYLIPVFDNTNPYIINNGNPDLIPAVSHSISTNYNDYNPRLGINIFFWANAATSINNVIENIILHSNGIQEILPINAGRSKTVSGNGGITKQNKFSQKFSTVTNAGFYFQYRQNPFNYNKISSTQHNNQLNTWFSVNLNWNDKFEWNNGFNMGYNKVRNNNTAFRSYKVFDYEISSDQVLRWPKHIIFENSLGYARNNSVVDPSLRNYIRWNFAVNITMLKDEAGVLRLGVYDILKEMNNIGVSLSQNSLSYNNGNFLGHYFIATFTYNIRAFGAKKKVGGSSLFMF